MKTSDFYYDLPEELIAQTPLEPRDSSRLMVMNRKNGQLEHRHFYDIIAVLLNQLNYIITIPNKIIIRLTFRKSDLFYILTWSNIGYICFKHSFHIQVTVNMFP